MTDFVPNGLLGCPSPQRTTEASNLASGLIPNGLLSAQPYSNAPKAVFRANGLLQEDTEPLSAFSAGSGRAAEQGSSLQAQTFSGQSLTFKRKRKVTRPMVPPKDRFKFDGLLQIPIHRLMDQLSITAAKSLDTPIQAGSSTQSPHQEIEEQLWVDRYRPQHFMELLGDERVHREAFSWLKEWDWCVFGKRTKRPSRPDGEDNEAYTYQDPYHRPREKILLLSGPPGLGKTTLAHVIARQAGYSVMEINASDARSGQVIDDRVRPALETGSAIGSKNPVLVVIDEVDGATGDNASGFVNKLISLTYDKPKKKLTKRDDKSTRPLLRPIICICNDLYASSLTRLRTVARIVRVQPPASIHLVKRLRDICDMEGLKADSRALGTLVGIGKGDMRGCLNTLQFIKRKDQEVTESVIRSATAGMKEGDATLSSVMTDIFEPMGKKRVKDLGLTETEESKYVTRLSHAIDAFGAFDKIATGCFEHYTNLRLHDASFAAYEKAHEWLMTYDHMSGAMRSEREYAIIPYLSHTLSPFFPLFASKGGGKMERPNMDWENFTRTKTNEEILKSLTKSEEQSSSKLTIDYRHLVSGDTLPLEFMPMLNRIISPPLRPVNSQIIKPAERVLLERLLDIMVALDLRFLLEKVEDGTLVYRLDPPIDVFVTYDGKRAVDIPVSRYAIRQMIARELDTRILSSRPEIVEKGNISRSGLAASRMHSKSGNDNSTTPNSTEAFNKKRLHEATVDVADLAPTDFFGRPIVVTDSEKLSGTEPPAKRYRVTYKYNEGNSSAVRKPVKVASFLH